MTIDGVCLTTGGGKAVVTLTVEGGGTEPVTFTVTPQDQAPETVEVTPGTTETREYEWPEGPGTKTITVTFNGETVEKDIDVDCLDVTIVGECLEGGGGSATVTLTVDSLATGPVTFSVTAQDQPTRQVEVNPGETKTETFTYPEGEGTKTVTVSVDGSELAREEVPVDCIDIDKTAVPAEGTPVQAPEEITYSVKISNSSTIQTAEGDVVDTLPVGVLVVGPISDGGVLSADGRTITWPNVSLAAGASKTFTFRVRVTAGFGIPTLLNESTWLGQSDQTIHPVKAINAVVNALCDNDTPYYSVSVTSQNLGPVNEEGQPHTVTVEWFQADENGRPIIRNGAGVRAFDPETGEPYIDVYPLVNGSLDTGPLLWKGAAIDANGDPIDWPGYDLIDGIWVEVPSGGVRPASILKVTVNPTSFDTAVYPPATPTCNANPPENPPPGGPPPNTPPGTPPGELPKTGGDIAPQLLLALMTLITGAVLKAASMRAWR